MVGALVAMSWLASTAAGAGSPTSLPPDCPYISASGAGVPDVNALYARTSVGKWVAPNGAAIEYNTATEASEWVGPGSSAVWALSFQHTHKYYQPATAVGAETAPSASWRVRDNKKGGKAPAPTLSCSSIADSCLYIRLHSTGGAQPLLLHIGSSQPTARHVTVPLCHCRSLWT